MEQEKVIPTAVLPLKVTVFRTAMCGGGLSYDVYVLTRDLPHYDAIRYTTIHRDGKEYVNFPEATLPEEHFAMPQGWERYDNWLAHEKVSRRLMLDLAEQAFPELSKVREKTDVLPLLWVNGLLPFHETSETKIVKVRP